MDRNRKIKNECQNELDIQLFPFMKVRPGAKATFYCIKKNCMTDLEDCKRCPYYKSGRV